MTGESSATLDAVAFDDLSRRISQTEVSALLPARLTAEGAELPGRLALVAAERLSMRHVLVELESEAGRRFASPLVADESVLRRAVPGDGAAAALVARLVDGPGGSTFSWHRTGAASPGRGDERAMGVDQTHESVVVGDRAVVKWSVPVAPSPSPCVLARLFEAGFRHIPEPWGSVEGGGGLLATVDAFLSGARDGWSWCVGDVGDAALRGQVAEVDTCRHLGSIVAELHAVLADATLRVADRVMVAEWQTRAISVLDQAIALTPGDAGRRVRSGEARTRDVVAALASTVGTPVTTIHADLHVGQVLRWSEGLALIDFDGNPVLPPAERGVPEPAARDVAGMLQSLDHVGRVVQRRVDGVDIRLVGQWIAAAQLAFLNGYREELAARGLPELLDERLLLPFAVEQECREFVYAGLHLPRWRYVPDAAFGALVEQRPVWA